MKTEIDVTVQNEGTIFLFQPLTEVAKDWIAEHVGGETTYFGSDRKSVV